MELPRTTCVWMLFLILETALAFSQEVPDSTPGQNTIALGTGLGTPGQPISLPLYLSAPGQANIGELTLEISLPSPLLTFSEVERAFLAEQVEAKLSADVIESKIRVKASVPEGKGNPLPEGLIAFVKFKVSQEAKAGELKVLVEKVEMKDLEGKPIKTAGKAEGQINVIPKEMAPLAGCFFYMH